MEIFERVEKIIRALPGPLFVIELGACDGADTRRLNALLESTGKAYRQVALEPCADNYANLVRHTADLRIEKLPMAIGAVHGLVDLWYSNNPAYYGSSSIREPKETLRLFPGMTFEKRTVECICLDDLFGGTEVDFIWADIQGAEADLIAGGEKTLPRTRFMLTEYSDVELYHGEINLAEMMRRLPGWEIIEQYPHDVLLRNTGME